MTCGTVQDAGALLLWRARRRLTSSSLLCVLSVGLLRRSEYLAAIENKASEVLTSLHGDDEDPSAGGGGIPASSPATRAPTTTLTLELPATAGEHSASDNDDDDDDGERPFSFGELKKNLEQRLDVREHGGVT